MLNHRRAFVLLCALGAGFSLGADWAQFRGPHGLGTSSEKVLPTEWSADKNIVWRTVLPGAGASSPITVGKRIYLTCYSGYGMDQGRAGKGEAGKQEGLKRHLVCLDRAGGKILWAKEFKPLLPEHQYKGEGSYHGYAASTPASDGQRLYVFFGKSGVYCFDLDGKELWHKLVGKKTDRWGSGSSPLLYKNTVIINASIEDGSLVALDKMSGTEVWKTKGIGSAWNTPFLAKAPSGETELVISIQNHLLGLNPDTGKELWRCEGIHRYVCPSVVAHDGIVYVTGGDQATFAVRLGGRGDVSKTHVLWRTQKGSNVSSPIIHEGHLYWGSTHGGIITCQEAASGKTVYQQRLKPPAGIIYASPLLADGKLYFPSQHSGTFVLAATPKFDLLAHNVFQDDNSRTNASIIVSDGQLLMRNDRYLYCIGK
jgi:outer membrane protein assembly factor BamB